MAHTLGSFLEYTKAEDMKYATRFLENQIAVRGEEGAEQIVADPIRFGIQLLTIEMMVTQETEAE